MPDMVICKSCGFIMEQRKVGEKCPACGVPSKMFIPHDERISPRRKMLLSLDIHPVLVHFPQAFIVTIVMLAGAGLAVHGGIQAMVLAALRLLGLLLPFTIAFSYASGLFDGKIRFRKVTTPLLVKKIIIGALFFLFSCVIAAFAVSLSFNATQHYLFVIGAALPALGCASGLGLIGTKLINARFPG